MDISKELAKELLSLITETKGFVLEQAPDVVQQLLTYETLIAWIGTVLGLVLLCCAAWGLGTTDYTAAAPTVRFIVGMVAGAVGLPLLILNPGTLLQIYVAPKVYLIEYLSKLIGA